MARSKDVILTAITNEENRLKDLSHFLTSVDAAILQEQTRHDELMKKLQSRKSMCQHSYKSGEDYIRQCKQELLNIEEAQNNNDNI